MRIVTLMNSCGRLLQLTYIGGILQSWFEVLRVGFEPLQLHSVSVVLYLTGAVHGGPCQTVGHVDLHCQKPSSAVNTQGLLQVWPYEIETAFPIHNLDKGQYGISRK